MKHAQIDESTRGRGFVAAAIAVVLFLFAVFSTLAFLSAQTKTVENIMTSGKVDAYIDESTVDSHGYAINPITKRQDVGQVYELLPGVVYDKDPIIHVKANSETSYVYAVINDMLETPVCNAESSPTIAEQMENKGWQTLDFAPPEGLTGTVWYKQAPVVMSSTDTDVATFETFSIKQNMSLADMELLDKTVVSVTGLLIQADGFDNAKHAYRTVYGNAKPDVADDITVTFEYNGGSVSGDTTRQISVKRGHVLTADQIPVPTKTGNDFEGWYTDRACTSPFVESSSIENNTVLYAKWSMSSAPVVSFEPVSPLELLYLDDTATVKVTAEAEDSAVTIDPSNIQVLYDTPYVSATFDSSTGNMNLTGLALTNEPQTIYIKVNATDTTVETRGEFVVKKVADKTVSVLLDHNDESGAVDELEAKSGYDMPRIPVPTHKFDEHMLFDGYYNADPAEPSAIEYYDENGMSAHVCDLSNNAVLYAKGKSTGDVSVAFSNDTVPAYGVDGGKWTYKKTEDTDFIDIPNTLTVPAGSTLVEVTSFASDEPENPGLLESFKGFFASLTSGDDSSTFTDTPADSITFEVRCKDESVGGLLRLTSAENSIIDREKSPSGTIPVTSALTLTAYYKLVPKPLYFGGYGNRQYCPIFPPAATPELAHPGIHFYSSDDYNDEIENVCSMEDLIPYMFEEVDEYSFNVPGLYYLYDHTVATEPLYTFRIDNDDYCSEGWYDAFGGDYYEYNFQPPVAYQGALVAKDDNGNDLEYVSSLNGNTNIEPGSTYSPKIYGNGNKDTCIANNAIQGSSEIYNGNLSLQGVLSAYPFITSTSAYWINAFGTTTPDGGYSEKSAGPFKLSSVRIGDATFTSYPYPCVTRVNCADSETSLVLIRAFK